MKKMWSYLITAVSSVALCSIVLFFPMADGSLWHHPCVNVYSLFSVAFFIMNTIGLVGLANGYTFGEKPYTKERPAIETLKQYATSVVLVFFEVPLLLTVFFIDGGWKMATSTGLFVGGSLIVGGLIGELSANRIRKEIKVVEQRELEEQLRKEEG